MAGERWLAPLSPWTPRWGGIKSPFIPLYERGTKGGEISRAEALKPRGRLGWEKITKRGVGIRGG